MRSFNLLLTSIGKVSIGDKFPVRIMGIINCSPESFYKKSVRTTVEDISTVAKDMQQRGANIIDIGAMSTAPYLETIISVQEEIKRMREGIEAVKNCCNLPISVDTPRSEVAKEAIRCGADAVNDVTGLKYDKKMGDVVAKSKLPVIIGAYAGNQLSLSTAGNISGTIRVLNESLLIAKSAKIADDNIIIDPAIGFFRAEGKSIFFTKIKDVPWYIRDIEVISKLKKLKIFSKPICISVSRKSFIGNLLNLKTEERLVPSLVAEIICVLNGANLVRTHDVKETSEAFTMSALLY